MNARSVLVAGALLGVGFAGGVLATQWGMASGELPPAVTAPSDDVPAAPAVVVPDPPSDPPSRVASVPVSESAFFEDFTMIGAMERFDIGIFHRDEDVVATETWPGAHVPTGPEDECAGPDTTRTIERGERSSGFNEDWIYRCEPGGDPAKAHLMTSIGDTSGYSIGSFTPKQSFEDVTEVSWAINMDTATLSSRQFPEVKLVPVANFDDQNLPCLIGWLPCNTDSAAQLGVMGVSLQNREIHITQPSGRENFGGGSPLCTSVLGGDPACESQQVRLQMSLEDNGDGTLTMTITGADGEVVERTTAGAFPDGPVRVVFADHNYTPSKDGASSSFTWHWDDIVIQ